MRGSRAALRSRPGSPIKARPVVVATDVTRGAEHTPRGTRDQPDMMGKVLDLLIKVSQHSLGPGSRAQSPAAGCDDDKDRLLGDLSRA